MFQIIKRLLLPEAPVLGRWALKHNKHSCENYILNYYAEPGYPNRLKKDWREKVISEKSMTNDK